MRSGASTRIYEVVRRHTIPFKTDSRPDIVHGLLAGLVGGIAGSAAKLIGEAAYPPRTQGQQAPPAILAEKAVGHSLSKSEKILATQAMHWTLGSGIGALYGVAAEFYPSVTVGLGTAFGIAVMLSTHDSTLPLLGLNEPPTRQPLREQASELATHALYGCVTECVRRWMMRRWKTRSDLDDGWIDRKQTL